MERWFQYAGLKDWDFATNKKGQTIARYWGRSGRVGYGKVTRRTIRRKKRR